MTNLRVTRVRPPRKSPGPATPKARYLAGVYVGSALIVLLGLIILWRVFSAPNGSAPIEISPTARPSLDMGSPTSNSEIPTQLPTIPAATPANQTATESTVPTSQPTAIPTSQLIPILIKPALEGETVTTSHGTITLSNLQNIKEFSRLGYGKPEDVDISPNQTLFAIATSAGVFVYNDNNTFNMWVDPQGWATSVQFSPDGNSLAIGLLSGEIQVWDWKNYTQSFKLSGHSAKISKLLFSSNGRYLYSASYDQNVSVWDMQTGEAIITIPAHSAPVKDISVTDDGRMLASCSSDSFVRIWDLSSGKKLDDFLFAGNCEAVAFSSDGEYLAYGGDTGYLYQWIVKSHLSRTDIVPIKKRIWTIQYIENNNMIFVGMDDGSSRVLNAAQEKYPGTSMTASIPQRDPKLVDAYGSQFEFDETFAPYGNGTDSVSIQWDGTVKHQATPLWTESYDSLDKLFFSPDGSFLATNGRRGLATAWNVAGNQAVFRETSGIRLPSGDPIAPNDSAIIIIIPTSNRNIYQQVGLTGASRKNMSDVVSGGIVSYARDGSVLVSGNLTQSKAWDFRSSYEVKIDSHPNTNCWVTKSSNDGEILQVVSTAGVFPIWNEKVEKICLKSYALRGSLFAYSDDFDFLTYTTSNGLIEGFDTVSNKVMWNYDPHEKITAIASSSDGQIVALGSQSGKLIFLNGEDGKPVFTTTGNFGEVTSIKFSRDGNWIATAGSDGVVRLFSIPINR
jgi:WD40 repeat protein